VYQISQLIGITTASVAVAAMGMSQLSLEQTQLAGRIMVYQHICSKERCIVFN